ncbi:MAG: type IX secretion system sortase PorU [Chitinophagales bacterium]|nr:type IX secretion system sortase PorU [Chitinophagales bacterium]
MLNKLKAHLLIALIAFVFISNPFQTVLGQKSYVNNSVLSSGSWYKFQLDANGIYILDYNFLKNDLGVSEPLNFSTLGVFGNGGGMLPEENADFYFDDLQENYISTVDVNGNGELNSGDYIIFYGKGPLQWTFSTGDSLFYHATNIYDDHAYYFFSPDKGSGKRVQTINETQPEDLLINTFNDYKLHETETENLDQSGRLWLGETFTTTTSVRTFDFNIPDLRTSDGVHISSSVVAASIGSSPQFAVKSGNNTILTHSLGAITGEYATKVATSSGLKNTFIPSSNNFSLSYQYSQGSVSSRAWLDYIALNFKRNLTFSGDQMLFRSVVDPPAGSVAKYSMTNAISNLVIWEVSNWIMPAKLTTSLNASTLSFKAQDPFLREYIAFRNDKSSFFKPDAIGQIDNQNLHGLNQIFPDMFIVTVDSLVEVSETLADLHRQKDGLSVEVIDIEHIYNEFSSGAQDLSAVRNFMKMFYDKAAGDPGKKPRYLLLMGDASYDYKDRIQNNTNLVPTYQSTSSINPTTTYTTDDYFGFLDDSEGGVINNDGDLLDIAIGRIPAKTVKEAQGVINKIFNYIDVKTLGSWRNYITFIGDDEDLGIHLEDADDITKDLDQNYPVYNIDKIYLDAYSQISTPGGDRYPDVNSAILSRLFAGSLIMNYTGHGGVNNWAHERIFSVSDIQGLKNFEKLPLFVTATCEFSRYDDPAKTSAGELLLLNPNGGGIGLVTTVRLVYSSQNKVLSDAFYSKAFELFDGRKPTMGEVMMQAKNSISGSSNNRKFVLLGDPALKLAYPEYNVVSTTVEDVNGNVLDTISALDRVVVKGEIQDEMGGLLSGFNGVLSSIIFDKKKKVTTLRNDTPSEGGTYENFEIQNSALFKGKASVTDGRFSFSFIVPKDIDYRFGVGKISFYAEDGSTDAHGYSRDIIIGGSSDEVIVDNEGPKIDLFMNDIFFTDGGLTDENPILLVLLEDENGINMTGNGIGHDISAILDGDDQNKIILNEFYEAELDNFRKGIVSYPLFNLEEGQHTIKVKAWDVLNNSSEESLTFVVKPADEFVIEDVMNYPNPVFARTTFQFEHNMSSDNMDITVNVYSMDGSLVTTLKNSVENPGYRVNAMEWDGTTSRGTSLGKGIYLFNVTVETESERISSKFEKLVILK